MKVSSFGHTMKGQFHFPCHLLTHVIGSARSFFISHEITKDVIVCAVFEHRNTEFNRTASSDKLVNVKQPELGTGGGEL